MTETLGNYHPDYGFPDEERREAVQIAEDLGTRKATELTGFGRSSICRWLQAARANDTNPMPRGNITTKGERE
jgi:hypothetical protein